MSKSLEEFIAKHTALDHDDPIRQHLTSVDIRNTIKEAIRVCENYARGKHHLASVEKAESIAREDKAYISGIMDLYIHLKSWAGMK